MVEQTVPAPRRPDARTGLRRRWWARSIAAGWPFPGDWRQPAVDDVCAALTTGADVGPGLTRLGAERAESGAGLDECLDDLGALWAVVGDRVAVDPVAHQRALALGWADRAAARAGQARVIDPLTGLVAVGYLRQRLVERYAVGLRGSLLVVRLDLDDAPTGERWAPLVLTARVLRAEYRGRTLARLGAATATVLLDADDPSSTVVERCRRLVEDGLRRDQEAAVPAVVTAVSLPTDLPAAGALLDGLGG